MSLSHSKTKLQNIFDIDVEIESYDKSGFFCKCITFVMFSQVGTWTLDTRVASACVFTQKFLHNLPHIVENNT